MAQARPLRLHRLLAALGALTFLVHVWIKQRHGLLPELLWGCNLSAAALILGFAFEWDRIVGAAFLWRLILGEPGFVVGVWSGERYFWTTIFVHLTPTLLAALYLRRSGLPKGSALWALAFCGLLVPLGRYFGPPELNINFGHQRLVWLEAVTMGTWSYRGLTALLLAVALGLGEALGRWTFGTTGRPPLN